jgi:deazaflavin-dependent oxidoreductase (nitroreductase family)
MAKQYRLGFVRRMINSMVTGRIRKGKAADNMYLLTSLGRKTGQERTTPVTLAVVGGDRYLVSPYGNVGWVFNVRAAGLAELTRGDSKEEISLLELDAEAAAPILKHYVQDVSAVRPFFDVDKDAPVEDFAAEASRHPVFKIS